VKTVLSLLFAWALSRDIMAVNPAARVKKIRRPADAPEANRRWTVAELQIVMAAAPFEIRVAIGLAVCTALRERDLVRWPGSGYKDGKIRGKRQNRTPDLDAGASNAGCLARGGEDAGDRADPKNGQQCRAAVVVARPAGCYRPARSAADRGRVAGEFLQGGS